MERLSRMWISLGCDRKLIRKKKSLVETTEFVASPVVFGNPKKTVHLFSGNDLRRHFLAFVCERARMNGCVCALTGRKRVVPPPFVCVSASECVASRLPPVYRRKR